MKHFVIFLLTGIVGLSTPQIFGQTSDHEDYVIVLDIQEHFTQNLPDSVAGDQLIKNINQVTSQFDEDKIIYVKSVLRVLSITSKGFQTDTLDNLDFDQRLDLHNDLVYFKTKANAFTVNELVNVLQKTPDVNVYVVGLMAEQCVKQTLLGGMELGFQMYALPDAIIGKSEKSKEKVLNKLKSKGVLLRASLEI